MALAMDQAHTVIRPGLLLKKVDALNLALRETRGTQFASRPFHGLVPSLHPVGNGFDPLSLVALVDRSRDNLRAWGTRLLRLDQ